MAFCFDNYAGDHLISHTVARAVPSAQRGLTSVFGMGTGDPSQYGHRQALALCGRPKMVNRGPAAEILSPPGRTKDLRFAFDLWMALGGMVVPQPAATSTCPGLVLPGPAGTQQAIWRQQS
jgi:hypothetical protein